MPNEPYFNKDFENNVCQLMARNKIDCVHDEQNACMLEIINRNISIEEIEYAIKKLKSGKAPGIDRIPVEFIKETVHVIKYELQYLYNYILSYEIYPESWGEGLRVAIPKGKDDIRPITIDLQKCLKL